MATSSNRTGYSATSLYSSALRRRTRTVVGYETPNGHSYCPDCAEALRKVAGSTPYRASDYTEWSITCEECGDSILESEE
jgi:uncharacterized protein with PIN domain